MRPDDASVSDNTFSALDFVAARPSTNGWIEVTGKPSAGKWFQKGYVRADALTFKKTDTDLSALYRRAMETKDQAVKETRLNHLRDDNFKSSQLYALIFSPSNQSVGSRSQELNCPFDGNTSCAGGDAWTGTNITYVQVRSNADNSAVSLDGISSYLEKPVGDDLQNVSYCFWLRAHAVNTSATIMMLGNGCTSGYGLTTAGDGDGGMRLDVLCGGVQTNVTNSSYSLPVNQWVHVALIKQGNTFSLYINGKLSSEGTSSHNALDGTFSFGAGMGCNPPGYGGFFGCDIDDLYISNEALTPEEIQNVYDAAG